MREGSRTGCLQFSLPAGVQTLAGVHPGPGGGPQAGPDTGPGTGPGSDLGSDLGAGLVAGLATGSTEDGVGVLASEVGARCKAADIVAAEMHWGPCVGGENT